MAESECNTVAGSTLEDLVPEKGTTSVVCNTSHKKDCIKPLANHDHEMRRICLVQLRCQQLIDCLSVLQYLEQNVTMLGKQR